MSQLYRSPGWENHTPIEGPSLSYPIDRDLSAVWYNRRFQGPLSTYEQLPLDTPDPDIADAYFVRQSDLEVVDGGEVAYTRTFSTIPESRVEMEGTTYIYPAIIAVTTGGAQDITNIVGGVVTVASHGYTPGNLVAINASVALAVPGSVIFSSVSGIYTVLSADTNTFTVSPPVISGATFMRGTVTATLVSREIPTAIETQLLTQYDYFLPGVTGGINAPEEIPLTPRFRVVDAQGREVQSIDATTVPSASDYAQSILSGEYIVESSYVRPWIGNIYERVTRRVIAQ